MEDVVEFLSKQLGKAIEDAKEFGFGSSSIFAECSRLKDKIDEEPDYTIRRENLYYLNNIVAEWRIVLENHSHYSLAAQKALNGQLADRLKKIRKALEAHHGEAASRKHEKPEHKKEKEDDGAAQEVEASQGKKMKDVVKFLSQQLTKAIEDAKKFGPSPIFEECSKLKDKIQNEEHDDTIRRENLDYLNNIVAEWRIVLENHSHYSLAARKALNGQLADRLKKIRKALEAHHGEAASRKDEKSEHEKAKSDKKLRRLENPYHVDSSKILGIDDKSMAMERLLVRKETRNREFQAIGIVGMTGVGKTTFCQFAFNNEEVKKHFLPRIWVEMSKQPVGDEDYEKEVVKSFLRSLGFSKEVIKKIGAGSNGLSLLLLALRKQLQGKRYLVVLDDIWHLDQRFKQFCSSLSEDGSDGGEERLSCGLPKGSGGCVIVTSRSESWAADMVGEKNLKRITPLADTASIWKIFKNSTREKGHSVLDKEKQEEMEEGMKKQATEDAIVKICAGLPLMTKMLAQDMVNRFLHDKRPNQSI